MDLRAKITDAVYDHPRADDQINAVMEVVEPRFNAAFELHLPYVVTDNPMELCRTCDTIYPCATKLALDGGQ